MKKIETLLIEEKEKLNKLIKYLDRKLVDSLEGHLRVRNWRGNVEYYFCDNYSIDNIKNRNGRYLKKNEIGIARKLAQRDYDSQILKKAKDRVAAIEEFVDKYSKSDLNVVYTKLIPGRKVLVEDEKISNEEFIKQWEAVKHKGKPMDDEMGEIITNKGERVRSKSEKIIADKLYSLGIAYKYECPLILSDNTKVYPDFTILKMPERKEVYLEHFGMMDNVDYVKSMVSKLRLYEKNGLILGVNMFFTQETEKYPLNTKALTELLMEVFCVE